MFETEQGRKQFLADYQIEQRRFDEAMLDWDALTEIAEDYRMREDEHMRIMSGYENLLKKCACVHSLCSRRKKTGHVIEKIIRKNPDYIKEGGCILKSNYLEKITDILGVRVLLLFKEDWIQIHDYINELFGDRFAEPPFVHIRPGDNEELYEGRNVEIKSNKSYRSAHYLIQDDSGLTIEVQVRTLFEEAWSEIEHRYRYPYNMSNKMIEFYLDIMNRIAGMGDEMGTFLNSYLQYFLLAQNNEVKSENQTYHLILERLAGSGDEELKTDIKNLILQSEKFEELKRMKDVFEEFMKG